MRVPVCSGERVHSNILTIVTDVGGQYTKAAATLHHSTLHVLCAMLLDKGTGSM